uniref:Uncharacterized protein n=1 Tax=viral metagenome TaxID=1070528 RepID=A0A6H2A5I8_9ZZZZ
MKQLLCKNPTCNTYFKPHKTTKSKFCTSCRYEKKNVKENMLYPPNHRCKTCKEITIKGLRMKGLCKRCYYLKKANEPKAKAYRKKYYSEHYYGDPEKKIKHAKSAVKYWTKRLKALTNN